MRTERRILRIGLLTATLFTAAVVTYSLDGEARPAQNISEWKAPEEAKKVSNPIEANADSLKKGKALYDEYCSMCHGDGGAGDGPMAANLDPGPGLLSKQTLEGESDGEIYWKISKGKDAMPDFENMISKEEIWHLVNYLRGF